MLIPACVIYPIDLITGEKFDKKGEMQCNNMTIAARISVKDKYFLIWFVTSLLLLERINGFLPILSRLDAENWCKSFT